MLRVQGDVFDLACQVGGVAVIGTNCTTNLAGSAVMGRGAALKAAGLHPELPARLGRWLARFTTSFSEPRGTVRRQAVDQNQYTYLTPDGYRILCFMVKYGWWQDADPLIIQQQAAILRRCAQRHPDCTFFMTRVGCGYGRLSWENVAPLLSGVLELLNVRLVEQ